MQRIDDKNCREKLAEIAEKNCQGFQRQVGKNCSDMLMIRVAEKC